MKRQDHASANIEGLHASLRYLLMEADEAGLYEVVDILKHAILKCDKKYVGQKRILSFDDIEMIKAIKFLHLFFDAPKAARDYFIDCAEEKSPWVVLKSKATNENIFCLTAPMENLDL